VTTDTTVGSSDLNNEIVYDSVNPGTITLPAANSLGATIDDAVYVYMANTGAPAFAWTGGTIRTPAGMPTAVRYGYIAAKWTPAGEWALV
jgi:hypothetical protein